MTKDIAPFFQPEVIISRRKRTERDVALVIQLFISSKQAVKKLCPALGGKSSAFSFSPLQ